jgi:hypothetical protein
MTSRGQVTHPPRVASVKRNPVYSALVIAGGRIMKLISFTASGHSSYGAVVGGGIVDLGRRLGDRYPTLRCRDRQRHAYRCGR